MCGFLDPLLKVLGLRPQVSLENFGNERFGDDETWELGALGFQGLGFRVQGL